MRPQTLSGVLNGRVSRRALAPLILAALACTSCAGKLTGPTNTYPIPPALHAAYVHDAGILAWRDFTANGSLNSAVVEIPADKVAAYVQLLERVYLADSTRAPFATLHIHSGIILDSLVLSVRSTATWLDAFKAGATVTGEPHLDALIREYGISAGEIYNLPERDWSLVEVRFPRQLNTSALLPEFRQIEGVVYAEQDEWAGYGNALDIRVFPLAAGQVRVEYSDDGCMTWRFRVTPDSVVFLGSSREPC